MADSTISAQLSEARALFHAADTTDLNLVRDYAWTLVKALNSSYEEIGAHDCRLYLAECLQLPLQKPSLLYSGLLSAAIKVAAFTHEMHFVPFLQMWNLQNLRPDDFERVERDNVHNEVPAVYPSLVDRVVKAYMAASLLRPEEALPDDSLAILRPTMEEKGYLPITPMIVTRIKDTTTHDQRHLRFVSLVSPEGVEVECVMALLKSHPMAPLSEGKRHFVHVGQLYDVLLRRKRSTDGAYTLVSAYLSRTKAEKCYPLTVGYVDSIDAEHDHIHVFDTFSRHFVSSGQKFVKAGVGQFVTFLPVVPQKSRFKSAIIMGSGRDAAPVATSDRPLQPFPLRSIRITAISSEKHYASWTLVDTTQPVVEMLREGTSNSMPSAASYVSGYLSLQDDNTFVPNLSLSSSELPIPQVGDVYEALIYLRRGKDGTKHPHVARLRPTIR